MADLLVLIMRNNGYIGLSALNGPDGLALIHREMPDLILLDLMLPDMDGWEIYRQLKADDALWKIPVIVVSCKSRPIDELLARNIAKVDDYIPKPFSPGGLVESIEKVLSTSELIFQS
jgi:DNA-binding response OmpR family regulator